MGKLEALEELKEEMMGNTSLPLQESNLVFGEGNPDPEVLFIGEAPGFNENEQRRPFVGRAGQLFRKLIRDMGWKEEDVYITNIVKRRPPENRDPLPEEITAYKPYLARQIQILKPKVIVALGRFSMNYFVPTAKISRDHGKIFKLGSTLFIPLYHPAAALRATNVKVELERDIRKLPVILKKYDELITSSSLSKDEDVVLPPKKEEVQKELF